MSDRRLEKLSKPIPRWVIPAVLVLFLGVLAVAGVLAGGLLNVADERHATIEQLAKNNDALRAQVQKLGAKPVAPPASEVIQGTPGVNGINGTNGINGKDGRGFVQVTCEADGTWQFLFTDDTTETIPGPCKGVDGANGANGTNGVDGVNGTNGTNGSDGRGITGVTCVREPDLSTAFRFTFTDSSTEDVPAGCVPN